MWFRAHSVRSSVVARMGSRWMERVPSLADGYKHLAARIIDVLKHPEIAAEWARRNRKLVEEKANQAAHMGYMTDIYRKVLKVNALLALGLA